MAVDVRVGDCRTLMNDLDEKSVNCCVTSPPYFGLRDYGDDGQIGLEQTPDEYVSNMVDVFRCVWRVLRDDGTLWLNLGDSYAANRPYQVSSTKGGLKHGPAQGVRGRGSKVPVGLKSKDLIGIPWRVAFALQADGWYLRQDIIWAKPNAMPESVRDRCTKSHEYIFLFSKRPKYYYNSDLIKEQSLSKTEERKKPNGLSVENGNKFGVFRPNCGVNPMRNKRSVWTITTKPYKGAHFATFPPDLIEPCILAGCPPDGIVLDPFGGSGTTAGVAERNGRNSIICELNPEYAILVDDRVKQIINQKTSEGRTLKNDPSLDSFMQKETPNGDSG